MLWIKKVLICSNILINILSSYVFGDNTKCIDKSPYCTKDDCTVRPGYAREYCLSTCSNCEYFCQDSTYISCADAPKEGCNEMLKEYCPILCGLCKELVVANKTNTIIQETSTISVIENKIPEVKILLKGDKNDSIVHGKPLKDDAIKNDNLKTLRSDTWYENQHNRKMIEQQKRYYGNQQQRFLPTNLNSPAQQYSHIVDPVESPLSDTFVEPEVLSPSNLAVIGTDMHINPYNSLSQREQKRKEIMEKEPSFANDYKLRRRQQNINVEKDEDNEYEDYEEQSKYSFNNEQNIRKNKNRNKNNNKIDHNSEYLQNSIFPGNNNRNNRNNIENELNINTAIKGTDEMEDKVSNLPPLAIADLLTLLGCRDRDQQICSKITEEACRARPGFYLKVCPVTCKNCNGLLCMDSNKVDCNEVKRLGGCRLQMSEEYCPKTCNTCPTPNILAESTPVCKDEMDTCEQLAESGVCNNAVSMAAMRVYCAKSCNFCRNTHLYLSNSAEEDDHPNELNALWMLKKQERHYRRHPTSNPK
uniref:ShKT domain-containing protein n=1 Tax=Parastrongyloides trichosuri TaxID=131310 RepID=A0A0N5A2K0_PARTI